jgi:hypothetical protein
MISPTGSSPRRSASVALPRKSGDTSVHTFAAASRPKLHSGHGAAELCAGVHRSENSANSLLPGPTRLTMTAQQPCERCLLAKSTATEGVGTRRSRLCAYL